MLIHQSFTGGHCDFQTGVCFLYDLHSPASSASVATVSQNYIFDVFCQKEQWDRSLSIGDTIGASDSDLSMDAQVRSPVGCCLLRELIQCRHSTAPQFLLGFLISTGLTDSVVCVTFRASKQSSASTPKQTHVWRTLTKWAGSLNPIDKCIPQSRNGSKLLVAQGTPSLLVFANVVMSTFSTNRTLKMYYASDRASPRTCLQFLSSSLLLCGVSVST